MCGVCVFCLCDFDVWCHNDSGEVAAGCVGKPDRKRRKPSRRWCFICRNLVCQISVQWILAPFRVKSWKVHLARFQVPVKIGVPPGALRKMWSWESLTNIYPNMPFIVVYVWAILWTINSVRTRENVHRIALSNSHRWWISKWWITKQVN